MQASVSTPQNRNRSGRWPKRHFRQPRRQAAGPRPCHPRAGRRGRAGIGRAVVDDRPGSLAEDSDRLEASKLLADRGWGKAAVFSRRRVIRSTWLRWRGRRRSSGRRSFGWLRSRKQARTQQWLQASRRHRRGLRGRVTCGPLRGPTALPAVPPETESPVTRAFSGGPGRDRTCDLGIKSQPR